jgi:hypothetical protein
MRYVLVLATLGMILLGGFMPSASAQVKVFVGYLDNVHGAFDPDELPLPFEDAAHMIISGGITTPGHDTGVIRFENISDASVSIDLVRVVTEGEDQPGLPPVICAARIFRIWDEFLPVTLAPGEDLVLAATETEPPNFDSSDCGLRLDPVVIFKITGGPQFTCVDQSRVLLGREDAGQRGQNETTQYQMLLCTQSAARPLVPPTSNN